MIKDFLAIVTKRRHSTGGSRPGARGPYRKLNKVGGKEKKGAAAAAAAQAAAATLATAAAQVESLTTAHAAVASESPISSTGSLTARSAASTSVGPDAADGDDSGRSTPLSAPDSSDKVGSERSSPRVNLSCTRARSPTAAQAVEDEEIAAQAKSPLKRPHVIRTQSHDGEASDGAASLLSSPAFTPGGTVVGLGTPPPGSSPAAGAAGGFGQLVNGHGEASLEVLLALRRLQEQNEQLQQENERLRAKSTDADPMVEAEAPTAEQAKLVVAAAEIARADVGMSC